MNHYLSFSSRPIPDKGCKSIVDGVIEGDVEHICLETMAIMRKISPDTPKIHLPAYANAKYKDGHKIGSNWLSCNVLHIDIDQALPEDAVAKLYASPNAIMFYQTPSSKPEHLKMRVYVFLAAEITGAKEYVANYDYNCKLFLTSLGLCVDADRQTKDAARFMYISARPETLGWVKNKPFYKFDTDPKPIVVNGRPTYYPNAKSMPTTKQYAMERMHPLMVAYWLSKIKTKRWQEGEKHLQVLIEASRAAGYGVPIDHVIGGIMRTLPKSVKDYAAAEETIRYGYARPRFPGFHEWQWWLKQERMFHYAMRGAVRAGLAGSFR